MTEQDFDAMLPHALLTAMWEQWEPLTAEGPALVWAPKRWRVMKKVLEDPFGYGARWAGPRWRRTLRRAGQTAACLLLTAALALAFSPGARAWAGEMVRSAVEWLDTHTRIVYSGEAEGTMAIWRPTYLPEGFQEVGIADLAGNWVIDYENEDGDRITFDYVLVRQGSMSDFDNEHSDYEQIIMNGQLAHFFRSNTEGKPSSLIWYDEGGTTAFQIVAYVEPGEVLKIAESVKFEQQ